VSAFTSTREGQPLISPRFLHRVCSGPPATKPLHKFRAPLHNIQQNVGLTVRRSGDPSVGIGEPATSIC